jgi:hypothetical protein
VALGLSNRRLRISPASDFRIAHLLVVSGPSGSGKTTFLRQLAAGRLSPELIAALPAGAGQWPETNGFGIRRRARVSRDTQGRRVVEGVVLHYDIMRVVDTMIDAYADDPTLLGLDLADEVSVAVIRAPAERLARQVLQKRPDPGRVEAMLKAFERRLRLAMRPKRRAVYREATFEKRRELLARCYAEPHFLQECYERWESFMRAAAGSRLRSPILHVEPAAANGACTFRLMGEGAGV